MTEYNDKIEQIENILDKLELDELVHCCSYLEDDNAIYPMDEFDELLYGKEPWDIARAVHYGDFYPTDNYFKFNVYGNLESTDNPIQEGWLNLYDLAAYAIDYHESFGDSDIQALLEQWDEEEEENNEEVAE